ncbi:uncharacterized protein LOC116312039 [Oreochromis aureus]|uniref:uncharacterized protein LOC116312039 n=1 Tax=Oreochromis aureus TaxID=47969 RepID=UPI0012BC05B0|nr:uncharacterized protein LOC116312039 [Oreochromis aureus]XP_039461586.1 uncharacterized protein LOC116312039 [Oreochromis aureus]
MQEGVLRRSQLLDSLKAYLSNKGRLQPIIGLGCITECVKAGAWSTEALYVCGACMCCLSKADMRNHILGSLHRFNYIKTWHPQLVSKWQDSSDLSKLAWPLMEMAKKLEEKEGPGDIQLLEVEDGVYRRMETSSENDAVTLIGSLRDAQGETESYPETIALHYPTESQRTVVFAQNQPTWSKKSFKADTNSEHISSFPDDYTGTKTLIGLDCVAEYRSEDGCSYCFLCHCCRIKSNKKDITEHLTSPSHLINYLMETHPEEVEEVIAELKDKPHLLHSLAKKVERETGRGELKVVHVPENLCVLLTGKSYHWCIKMLQCGWKGADIKKKGIAAKGLSMNQTSAEGMPEKCTLMKSKRKKRVKAKRRTGFNVSLPIAEGLLLLKRTSFSRDGLPPSATSPPFNLDLTSSPGSEIVELDCDGISSEFNHAETSPLQHNPCDGGAETGGYTPEGNFTIPHFQNRDGCVRDGVHFSQSEDITGRNDYIYWKIRENGHHVGQEKSAEISYKKWENEEMHNEAVFPAVPSSSNSSYGHGECWTEQGYKPAAEDNGTREQGLREEAHKDLGIDAGPHYYQQHFQNPHMPCVNASLQTGSVSGYHDVCGHLGPYINSAGVNMLTQPVDPCVYSSSIAQYTALTNDCTQAASHNYGIPTTAYEASQGQRGWIYYPSYNTGPLANPGQHFLPPVCSSGTAWSLTHSYAFSQPYKPQCAASHTDLYFS